MPGQRNPDHLAKKVLSVRPMHPLIESRPPWSRAFVPERVGEKQPSRAADDWLIDCALQDQPTAFGELVEPHLSSLTRFARMRLRNHSEAEDVVQQAVLLAFYNLGQFRREASFKTWLSKIMSNEVIHLRRGRAVARLRPLHETRAEKLPDPSSLPDAQIQRRQELDRLHLAVTRLPAKYRLVIQLRDLDELSVAATARSLSLTAAAVKTRHHRARKLLMRSLDSGKSII